VNDISGVISGIGNAIGRYFGLVSFIPSFCLASFTFLLIKSGAWGGTVAPDWVRAGEAFESFGNIALLVLVSVGIGVITHPVQFPLVQFLEGYWGVGKIAQRLRVSRIIHHQKQVKLLEFGKPGAAEKKFDSLTRTTDRDEIELRSVTEESERLRTAYPYENGDIMPTRLGNVLRKYERRAGAPYNLDAIYAFPHIALVAAESRVAYLNDQRQALDLAVRMCGTSLLAVLVAIAFLWHDGPWLLVALVPYAIAYISYRGAIAVAHEYGAAMGAILDLDRFALYSSLRIRQPEDIEEEREMNKELTKLLRHNERPFLTYEKPPQSPAADAPQSPQRSAVTGTQQG
jgi:hypothetical protein